MKRGDIVELAQGRAVVLSNDLFSALKTVTIVPISELPVDAPMLRVDLAAGRQMAIDKIITVPRDRIQKVVGQVDSSDMLIVSRMLTLYLGVA